MALAQLSDYEVLHESESDATSSPGSSGTSGEATSGTDGDGSTGSAGGVTTEAIGTDTDPTTTGELAPLLIDDHQLTPNPIKFNGVIDATIWSASADGVRIELDDGSVVGLGPTAPGVFAGEIMALTGHAIGEHDAVFVPRRQDEEGEPLVVTYDIAMGEPGDAPASIHRLRASTSHAR